MSAIDQLLDDARRDLDRLDPSAAAAAVRDGALLIDTRPLEQRRRDGVIPGALVIDRNVLEWRLDVTSAHRIPQVTEADQRLILLCNEGYSSSLAAATLRQLGMRLATDVVGGFVAWAQSGLPVARPDEPADAALPATRLGGSAAPPLDPAHAASAPA